MNRHVVYFIEEKGGVIVQKSKRNINQNNESKVGYKGIKAAHSDGNKVVSLE